MFAKTIKTLVVAATLTTGIAAALAPQQAKAGSINATEMQEIVIDEARKMKFPPALALAMSEVASNFDDTARGHKGAFGLMQVPPQAINSRLCLYEMDMWSPRGNVRAGLIWMSHLLVQNESKESALLAYRASSDPSEPSEGKATETMRRYRDMVMNAEIRHFQNRLITDNDRGMSLDGKLLDRAQAIVDANPSRCNKRGEADHAKPVYAGEPKGETGGHNGHPRPPVAARIVEPNGQVVFAERIWESADEVQPSPAKRAWRSW